MKKFLIYLLLISNFCVLLGFWWHFSGPLLSSSNAGIYLALGRLCGLIATSLILLQLILIGRVKWVETVFGLDKLSRIHRWNGYTILGLVILHPFLITLAHAGLNQVPFFTQYFDFLRSWEDLLRAFIGYAILMITIVLSITIVRKHLKYENWYYIHIFNYLAIALIFGHQLKFGSDAQSDWFRGYWYFIYTFAFGNIIWFRFIRPLLRFHKHQFRVAKVEPNGPATSIYITGLGLKEFKIKAGQFMIFRFLQKGFWWQAHPFSLSQAPRPNELRLTAKALGDFTNELPKIKPGTKVIIDGPHGIFTEELADQNKKLLFIAGGIGITPIFSMLEDMKQNNHDAVLLYSNKTRSETVFAKELPKLAKQNNFKLINILADEQVAGYETGRLDKAMIEKLVPDIKNREVFLCGPPPMMLALRAALRELGVNKSDIHFERFAL